MSAGASERPRRRVVRSRPPNRLLNMFNDSIAAPCECVVKQHSTSYPAKVKQKRKPSTIAQETSQVLAERPCLSAVAASTARRGSALGQPIDGNGCGDT